MQGQDRRYRLLPKISFYVIYHFLLGQVNKKAQDINHYGDEFLGVLSKLKKEAAG